MFNLKQNTHLSIGQRGEKAAALYLKKQGYKIIETNYKNSSGRCVGEIDIIAKDGEEYVFVEVKTRNKPSSYLNLPEENISNSKLYKLSKIASVYISTNNLFNANYRFDAISIISDAQNNTAQLKHLKNIFI